MLIYEEIMVKLAEQSKQGVNQFQTSTKEHNIIVTSL